ncbi:hypothetical protein HOB94_01875 [bacterium]|nr:hypothetical protein [bacterium]MBT4632743.1 hypothetical protein [bacterium]
MQKDVLIQQAVINFCLFFNSFNSAFVLLIDLLYLSSKELLFFSRLIILSISHSIVS